MIKKILTKWIIPKLLQRSCGEFIPRTGEDAEAIDCYFVAANNNSTPYFAPDCYQSGSLVGKFWDGKSFNSGGTITWEEFVTYQLRICHYYGTAYVNYDNIFNFAWHYFTKHIYIKIHFHRIVENIDQYFFNKRKLITKNRMDLLKFMMDDQINRNHNGIDTLDLMTKLYSIKWVLHPSREEQQKKLELYLDALVKSGEVNHINNQYVVTGKAINTLENYEEEERKHTEAVKLQKRMMYLTVILTLMAIIQAKLIVLPTFLDLSNTQTKQIQHKP